MTDDELRKLMEKATPGPWSYRSQEYDDWGVVRGKRTDQDCWAPFVCQARDSRVDDIGENAARREGRDPWEANARLIAAAPDLAKDRIRLEAENAALRAEVERLREALEPFATCLSRYTFPEHQIILLSEDNPKGRRLTHLLPEHFYRARAALGEGGE